ncbi:MAG: lycopene cyclase family protein [marine benthic group bacterium]|nr:lycopene cyclase family protein [Gemmatimonadota bacterium]
MLIAGGGAAGLSCAVQLSLQGLTRFLRVLIIEPRSRYERDRTWCFWNVIPHPFEDCVSDSWHTWSVSDGQRRIDRSWPGLVYQHLPADAFYEKASSLLAADPNVELRLGDRVKRVESKPEDNQALAMTDEGPLTASLVLDSRPRGARLELDRSSRNAPGHFLQHFHGKTVRSEKPVFSAGVATIMDFVEARNDGIHFIYLLPYDERTALIEDTWFSDEPRPVESYEEEISRYLADRFDVVRYEALHSETGAIPMDTRPIEPPDGPRQIDIGTRGGAARPSTGYAFLSIQRFAAALARGLTGWAHDPSQEPPRPPRHYSRRSVFLDRVFVSHLARTPEAGPDLFLRLFDRVRPDALARFLFDGGLPLDDLRVMAALPAAPLIGETLRQYAALPGAGEPREPSVP